MALFSLLELSGVAGCEAIWGSLSVPAPENCVLSAGICQTGQVCNPVSQLCENEVVLSQASPAHAKTSDQGPIPITITGANFVPGMVLKWSRAPATTG